MQSQSYVHLSPLLLTRPLPKVECRPDDEWGRERETTIRHRHRHTHRAHTAQIALDLRATVRSNLLLVIIYHCQKIIPDIT